MSLLQCPRVIHPLPLMSFTFGVDWRMSLSLHAEKGKYCLWLVDKVTKYFLYHSHCPCRRPHPGAHDVRRPAALAGRARRADGAAEPGAVARGLRRRALPGRPRRRLHRQRQPPAAREAQRQDPGKEQADEIEQYSRGEGGICIQKQSHFLRIRGAAIKDVRKMLEFFYPLPLVWTDHEIHAISLTLYTNPCVCNTLCMPLMKSSA